MATERSSRLSAADIRRFRTDGFLAIPGFFSDAEAAAMQAETTRLCEAGLLRNVSTDADGRTPSSTRRNLQICPIGPKSSLFSALAYDDRVVSAVRGLIGEPVILHLDQMFLKPAGSGMGTSWHQDNAYFRIGDPLGGTAMWTAVHEATVAAGTLHVIPGSHHEAYEHTRDPYSDHHIRCFPPEERAVPVELRAGGVVFFAYGTVHCTRDNTSCRDRAGLALHFITEAAARTAVDFDFSTHPYLTGPTADIRMDGAWTRDVHRILKATEAPGGASLTA